MSEQENFERIYEMLQRLITNVENLNERVAALEAKDVVTKPLWKEMRADQQSILERMDRIEVHLQQQDEKMEDGFRKLNDKFEIMSEEWFETRADLKHLKRRVTQLEPIN